MQFWLLARELQNHRLFSLFDAAGRQLRHNAISAVVSFPRKSRNLTDFYCARVPSPLSGPSMCSGHVFVCTREMRALVREHLCYEMTHLPVRADASAGHTHAPLFRYILARVPNKSHRKKVRFEPSTTTDDRKWPLCKSKVTKLIQARNSRPGWGPRPRWCTYVARASTAGVDAPNQDRI